MKRKRNKFGQVWIETVLYTLIGLALIGLVLAFALPKITNAQDKIIVQQTISSLKNLDQTINNVLSSGEDNVRQYEISFKRGEFYIDGESDEIYFLIKDLKEFYSEKDFIVKDGRVEIISRGEEGNVEVELKLNYENYANIKFNGEDKIERINMAATTYNFFVSNEGRDSGTYETINIRL